MTDYCEGSFEKIKEEIANDHVLIQFDPKLPLGLATDASPVGLGAVVSHNPIFGLNLTRNAKKIQLKLFHNI